MRTERSKPPVMACSNCKSTNTRRTGAFSVEPSSTMLNGDKFEPVRTLLTYDRRCGDCGAIFAERTVRVEEVRS